MTDPARPSQQKRSLFALIADLPRLIVDLVKGELEQLKNEIVHKLTNAGIGIGLLLAAGVFAFLALCVLIAAAILGLAVVLPGWLAALIIGVALLVITVVLALIGIARLKRSMPPAPERTLNSVKRDVRVIKGTGRRVKS